MKNKSEQSKTEAALLVRAQQGEEAAETTLLEQYKPLVRSLARELYLAGGDRDDLIQEGMLGLFKAIRHYDPQREASFATYARLLITRQMYTAIETAQRQKHQALNRSIPLSELGGQEEQSLSGSVQSPEAILVDLENTRELRNRIETQLSPLEKQVCRLFLEGYDYRQIAEQLHRPPKSIDNALQRIRKKLSNRLP